MGRNKNWKRKAKRIRGECFKGCDYCKFLNIDPYGYEDFCKLSFEDEECQSIRKLEETVKGINLIDMWGEKMV